jgi:hypothetical protein
MFSVRAWLDQRLAPPDVTGYAGNPNPTTETIPLENLFPEDLPPDIRPEEAGQLFDRVMQKYQQLQQDGRIGDDTLSQADPVGPTEGDLSQLAPADVPAADDPVADVPTVSPAPEGWADTPVVADSGGGDDGSSPMAARGGARSQKLAAAQKLAATRRLQVLSAVHWATQPMFAAKLNGCSGATGAACVRRLASSRQTKAAVATATPQSARTVRSAIDGNYATQARPFKPAQLASVTRKLAGARKMSGELDAAPPDSAPPADDAPPADATPADAVAPAPPAVAAASLAPAVSAAPPAPATADNVLDAIFRADFKGAMSMVQGTPALGQYEASVSSFVAAGQDMDKKRFAGARVTLRRVKGPPEMQRLADYWLCKSLRLEGMSVKAADCFSKAGLTDGVRP